MCHWIEFLFNISWDIVFHSSTLSNCPTLSMPNMVTKVLTSRWCPEKGLAGWTVSQPWIISKALILKWYFFSGISSRTLLPLCWHATCCFCMHQPRGFLWTGGQHTDGPILYCKCHNRSLGPCYGELISVFAHSFSHLLRILISPSWFCCLSGIPFVRLPIVNRLT